MANGNPVSRQLRRWQVDRLMGKVMYCALCHNRFEDVDDPRGEMTVDHIIPKALGGSNVKTNLQPAHKLCNGERGHRIMNEFRGAKTKQEIIRRALSIIDHARTLSVEELLRKV